MNSLAWAASTARAWGGCGDVPPPLTALQSFHTWEISSAENTFAYHLPPPWWLLGLPHQHQKQKEEIKLLNLALTTLHFLETVTRNVSDVYTTIISS